MSSILRSVLAVIAGVVSGIVVLMAVEFAGILLYPPPPGLDPSNPADVARLIEALPLPALLVIVAAWWAGSFAGGALAARLAAHPRAAAALTALPILAGVLAMIGSVPHPVWMSVAGLIGPVPLALLGARLSGRTRSTGA